MHRTREQKVERAIGADETYDFTPGDWFALAIACLDQAGATKEEQARVCAMLSRPEVP